MAERFHGIFKKPYSEFLPGFKPTPKSGIDLRLNGLPSYVTARDLNAALSKKFFSRLDYDYSVILERSAEELF